MAKELLEKEWFIPAPWGRICIVAFGNCTDPPVLLCHGMVDSAYSFKPILRLLPRNFYYVAMEIPGNGRSDSFPPGLNLSIYDMVYAVRVVVSHFRWERFYYMAHSLGAMIGKYYNLSYPGEMTRVVEFDPTPNIFSTVDAREFASWYHHNFSSFFAKYDKLNSTKEKAPLYSMEEALEMYKRNRGLTDETAALVLDRNIEHVGPVNIRFTFDQRTKQVTQPPLTPSHKQRLFTSIPTPTLAIVARATVQMGFYDTTPFCLDEKLHSAGNYRVRVVDGHHDVHVTNPERLVQFVTAFLEGGLDGFDGRAKL